MMQRNLDQAATTGSPQQRLCQAVRRLQRSRARVQARRARPSSASNAVTSLGMIVGLLIAWAAMINL